jgi:single-stranded-DNA-specific exonuclease
MIWEKKEIQGELVRELSGRFGCDNLTASILLRRGVTSGEDILFYLEDDLRYLHNPFLFSEMEDAVERILSARDEGEKVLIFGDRDADGITGTALLYRALKSMGIDVSWRVPAGDDPYGLTIAAVDEFAADYGTLIITVDCGISTLAEISHAAELGIEVIVVDHHNPQERLPEEAIIINPKVDGSGYPFRDLAGCGVTYKLITALRFSSSELYKQEICLLNVRPANDAYIIEGIKMVNMAEVDRISETIIPGVISIDKTRLLPFLQGQQILVWDEPLQQKQLKKAFGGGVEFNLLDIQPEIGKDIPAVRSMSLLRLKDLSRIARYQEKSSSELDGFFNIFITYIQKKTAAFTGQEQQDLQLVALGTLADLMPLKNENRVLIRQGCASLSKTPCPGIQELLLRQNMLGKKLGANDISWSLSPVINSTGRMGQPELAVQLLLEENPAVRAELADRIIQLNKDRRQLGNDIWTVIEQPARESLEKLDNKLVLVADAKIHRGVTGIMANRLVQCFDVPAIVITFLGEDSAVGSMRSTRGYDVRGLLEQCADLFIDHGGHEYAAGFSLARDNFEPLYRRICDLAPLIEFTSERSEETLFIDAELPHTYLTPELLNLVDAFEPYGEANEQLVFMARNMKIIAADIMGKTEKQHLKLTFDCGRCKWPAIFWQESERLRRDFDIGDTVDAVFRITRNTFNGAETAQMILLDVRRSGTSSTPVERK